MANELSTSVVDTGVSDGGYNGGAVAREATVPVKAQGREKAQIEHVMKTDRRRYNRDVEMQHRYLAILTAEDGGFAGNRASEPSLLPMPTPTQWRVAGNDPAEYSRFTHLAREANDILSAGDGAALGASFDRLPSRVQALALGTLLDRSPVTPTFVTGDEISRIMAIPAMQPLAREWDGDSPHRIGICNARLWRFLTPLSDADFTTALRWLNSLPIPVTTALMRKLAR